MSSLCLSFSPVTDLSKRCITEPEYIKQEPTFDHKPCFEPEYIPLEMLEPEYIKLEPTYEPIPYDDVPKEEFRREDFEDLFQMIEPVSKSSPPSSPSDSQTSSESSPTQTSCVPETNARRVQLDSFYSATRHTRPAESHPTIPVPWTHNHTHPTSSIAVQQPNIARQRFQAQQPPSFEAFQFRPPRNLGRELLSGIDELRSWNGEEVPETKTYEPMTAHLRPAPTHDKFSPQSLSELLSCVTNLGRASAKRKADDIDEYAATSQKYECLVCSRSFKSSSSLRHHSRIHTGEKPFECQICFKRFSMKSTLTTHIRIHTGSKPYQCQRCPKSFRDLSTYTKHQRVHSGEQPYTCSFCGRGFTQLGNMKRHSINIHGVMGDTY